MGTISKFAFDTEFSPSGDVVREAPKKFSAEEVEAECQAAYARGAQDATAQAERQAAAALQALADATKKLLGQLDSERQAMRNEAARLALAAARKVAGAALEAHGVERAAAAIEAVMDLLRHQPRLLVKLSPDAAEALKPRIDEMAQAHGYDATILVRTQAGLKSGEVIIDWSDGMLAMSPDDANAQIEALVETALASPEQGS
jgi:flagellar assembly protein FliH